MNNNYVIMDYEKKYKEAINRAKAMVKVANSQEEIYNSVITIFPELCESEDERIKKELIFYLGDMPEDTELRNGVTNRDVLVWLEKQGQPRMQYGITINGVEYELIKDDGADECKRCALHEKCHYSNEVICTQLFENSSAHHRFEKR